MKKLLPFFIFFFTLISYAQFPENFENAAIANNATPPATGWTTFTNGILPTTVATNNWQKSNLQFRGAFSARVRQLTVANGNTSLQWLVSPPVAKPVNGQVRFYTRKGQTDDQAGTYTLRYSIVPSTNPADYTIIGTWNESQISSTAWEQKFVPIPPIVLTGQNIYIAFVKEDAAGDNWFVDDIKVDSQCLTPTALTAAPLATSASLSWNSPNPAGPWQIEYGPAGFIPGATPAQGTIVNVTTNPYNLTGLTPMTSYTYYVRTMCDTDNPSPWSNSTTSSTTALPPVCGGNYIDEGGSTGNYPNNENRPITIPPTNPGEIVTVTFSDFNTEATFDALYVYDGPSTASPLISSGNPAGTVPGGLAGGYWGTAIPGPFTSSHPSGALTFVFRSDGLINRAGWIANVTCTTCPPPLRVNLVTATSNSLQISWTNLAPLSTSYEVICLATGSPAPTATTTGQVTTSNPHTITGLNSNTTYDVYVRPICNSTSTTGGWSVKGTFTTLPNYCAGDVFYDSGEATGNYSNNESRTFTICPQGTGNVVTLFFNSFNIGDDTLAIYDGNSTTAPLLGNFTGFIILPTLAASNTNTTGCLTFVFTSNANGTAPGWDANVVCGPACPSITAILDTANSTPLVNGKMNVCKNQNVSFAGTANAISGGGSIAITGATYKWIFDDGVVLNGQNVTRQFITSGVREVNLIVTLPGGCRSVNNIRQIINVSTDPVFTYTISDDEICTNQTSVLSVAHTMVTASQNCVPSVTGITRFLPDRVGGSPPVTSISEITIAECYTGRTITSAADIESVCMNIEHSYLGDLSIELEAPNGVSILLSDQRGGSTNLGIPWATATVDGQSNILTPGTGYNYCFNSTATPIFPTSGVPGITFPNGNGPATYTDSGMAESTLPSTNIYRPVGNFAAFIGAPIMGTWKLKITDNLAADNGYLFGWNLKFSPSVPTTSNQFTPAFASGSWSPSPDIITPLNNPQITVQPSTPGTKCYTYNLTNNFGCTYTTQQVCINVIPGVTLTTNTANPISVFVGQNGTYYFSGGTPNAVVTYNVNNNGVNRQIILDGSGNATVTIPGLLVNTTVTATLIAQQPIPTSGNVILTTSNASNTSGPNSHGGPLLPVNTIATATNSTIINNTFNSITFQLGHIIPIGTVVTIGIARTSNNGSCQIADGISAVNSITYNSGPFSNASPPLQHIQFTVGRATDKIFITQNQGTFYVDGMSYTFNLLGCDAPLNLPATILVTIPPGPVVCSRQSLNHDLDAIIPGMGDTYTYTVTSSDPANVPAGSPRTIASAANITDSYTNITNVPVYITYTVTPISSTGAAGTNFIVVVTVNPEPVVTSLPSPVIICSGTALNFDLDALIVGTGDTYTYTVTSSDPTNVPAGSPRTIASAANITDSYTNTTNVPVTITYIVTPKGSNTCEGVTFNVEVKVNPVASVVATPSSDTICSGFGISISLSTNTSTTVSVTYKWTASITTAPTSGTITGFSDDISGTLTSIAQTLINTGTSSGIVRYVVTPYIGTCAGTPVNVDITVNPKPLVTNQPVATCSDVALNFDLDALVAGSGDVFTYTVASSNAVSVPAGGPRTLGSAANITDLYTNNTTAPVTITYTVTPTGSNGCIGNTFTVIATINPEPLVTNQPVATCSDVALNYSLDALIPGSGDTFTYTIASSNAVSVPAAGPRTVASAANITDLYANTTTAPVTITYTVTPTSANGCIGNTFTVTATINPEPVVTNQPVATCSDVALNFDLASLILGSGDLYTYTVASSNAASVPAAGPRTVASAANITDVYTNTTTAPVTITYTVTPVGSNGCIGNTFTVTATINPEPLVTNQPVATCSDVALNFDLDALVAGSGDVFTYTVASSNAASVPAAGPRTVASAANITDLYTNNTTSPVTITYTVTPTGSNGCIGNTFTVIATVDPIATSVATPVSNFICTGTATSITLSTPTTGTIPVTFQWTASVLTAPLGGSITGFSSDNTGTLNTISQTLQNTGSSIGVVRYIITPFIGLCSGTPLNVDITVNPLGQVNVISPEVICPGNLSTAVVFSSSNTGTTTYTWVNDTPAIGLAASSGGAVTGIPSFIVTNTSAAPITGTITVIPTYTNGGVSCIGASETFTITVNPTPSIVLSSAATTTNQTICVNSPIVPIQYTFGAGVTGAIVTGLPSGINQTTNGNVVTISGTPTTTANIFNYTITALGNSCGAPNLSGVIEVTNGIFPIFAQVAPVCQGATINIPSSSSNTPPIVGVWNLISSTANDVTYEFTPNAGQCALTTTMTIVVYPLPTVIPSVMTDSFCSGGTTNINLTSTVPGAGTVFSWTATGTGITGQSGSITGSGATSINQTLVLNANQVASGQVTYVIVAEANGCLGAPVTVVVTVNPIPNVIVSTPTQTICSGQPTSISFSGAINNTVFTWNVVSSVGVSGAFNGSGTAINQTLITTGLSQGTVVYEVTPSLNGCPGTPKPITVTVNPVPEIFGSATHPPLCSAQSTFISVSTFNAATVYNWVVVPVGVSGAIAGTASGLSITIAQPLTTTGNTQGYVDYIITPVLTGCSGSAFTVRVYVNPLPVVSLKDGTICVDTSGVPFQSYLLDSGLNDVDYNFVWTFVGATIPGATIPGATSATYIATQVGTYTVKATNATTNCVSTEATAIVTPTVPATSFTVTQSEFFSDYAIITVNVSGGTGTLLYQLDDGILQESNVFTDVIGGIHIITVVDTQGCTYLTKEVLVIDYPKYFTPNGDGINDTWNIKGLNQTDATIFIFDRYGKLIKQITPTETSQGWDGTYIGSVMPSTDYWFTIEYKENDQLKQFKAHFSLKR